MGKEVYVVQEGAYWGEIEVQAYNTVVQIVAQVGSFNWAEPYKIIEQYENCGTGFFINEDGYIVTNLHVIDQAKHIWVHIPVFGKTPLEVVVISICPDRDLALLRLVDPVFKFVKKTLGTMPFLHLGNSDEVQRTHSILVLGYPLGQYGLKSTTGVISGRESIIGYSLLQFTAPVNPGSSGGPLLNVRGEVVAIAVAMNSVEYNVGYSLPINELATILDDMYSNRFVRKPIFGARLMYASDEKAQFFSNPVPAGLYIGTVFKGSFFEKIGIREGDMLYQFNEFTIDPYGEAIVPWSFDKVALNELVSRVKVGDTVTFILYRNGERKDLTCIVELLQPFAIREKYPSYELIEYEMIGGLVVMELSDNHMDMLTEISPELLQYKEVDYRMNDILIITHILPGSYAHQLRILKPGDRIKELNGESVTTCVDFKRVIEKSIFSGVLTLKTYWDVFVVFSLKRLLTEEKRLSDAFSYPITQTVLKLQQAFDKQAFDSKK